jgi:hypothetical protein
MRQDPGENLRSRKIDYDVSNLVLLRRSHTESSGKLEPKWDGPYVINEKTRLGPYHLADPQGPKLEHSWNTDRLHRF